MKKKGVLLINVGSPDSPHPRDVKKYLGEFLMDKRVLDIPYPLRALLVKGVILNTRPQKSAVAYQEIWWKEGAPLRVISEKLCENVQKKISVPVRLAMRYGNPSLESALQELAAREVEEVLLMPLYPQYAMATTETAIAFAEKIRKKKFPHLSFTTLPPFYRQPDYIKTLASSIENELTGKDWQHLLFSYHGIPERHLRKTDITKKHCRVNETCCQTPSPAHAYCYRHQCYETTQKTAACLGLQKTACSTSFQSRLGRTPWLQPYTVQILETLPRNGITRLAVVMPAFVCDCLETLEEIAIQGKKRFLQAGGSHFYTIPCLNDRDSWAQLIARWIEEWAMNNHHTTIQ